jgi:hypothetical protein
MKMLIKLTRAAKDSGEKSDAAVNPRYVTSAIYVPEFGLTAVNMYNQPTIWVLESPEEIAQDIWESEND